jgi:hypothetical protein
MTSGQQIAASAVGAVLIVGITARVTGDPGGPMRAAERTCKGWMAYPVGHPRQRAFCKRMCGMRAKNTGKRAAQDPMSCINQALRRWHCRCPQPRP